MYYTGSNEFSRGGGNLFAINRRGGFARLSREEKEEIVKTMLREKQRPTAATAGRRRWGARVRGRESVRRERESVESV
jgi:hypothetical protein